MVTAINPSNAQLLILSSYANFNPGSKLVVESIVFGESDISATWNVSSTIGLHVPFTSLTPTKTDFTSADAMKYVHFPLSVPPNTFIGGHTYVFRMTAYPNGDPNAATFAEVVLRANTPPTGGYITIKPSSGHELDTSFLITSPGFTTDVSAFPLSYAFSYRISKFASNLTIATASTRAFTVTTLPAGLPTLLYNFNVTSMAIDIFLAAAYVSIGVTVNSSVNTNVTQILQTGLTKAFSSKNVDLAFQVVNNVSREDLLTLRHFDLLQLYDLKLLAMLSFPILLGRDHCESSGLFQWTKLCFPE